jgi:hypothetical protein
MFCGPATHCSVTDKPDEDPKVGLESEKGSYDTMPKAEEDTSAVLALETSTVSGQQLDAMEELIGTTEAVLIYGDQERKKGHAEYRSCSSQLGVISSR